MKPTDLLFKLTIFVLLCGYFDILDIELTVTAPNFAHVAIPFAIFAFWLIVEWALFTKLQLHKPLMTKATHIAMSIPAIRNFIIKKTQ